MDGPKLSYRSGKSQLGPVTRPPSLASPSSYPQKRTKCRECTGNAKRRTTPVHGGGRKLAPGGSQVLPPTGNGGRNSPERAGPRQGVPGAHRVWPRAALRAEAPAGADALRGVTTNSPEGPTIDRLSSTPPARRENLPGRRSVSPAVALPRPPAHPICITEERRDMTKLACNPNIIGYFQVEFPPPV